MAIKTRYNKSIIISTLGVILVMLLASITPLAWPSYLLHQAGTMLFLVAMLAAYRYLNISSLSFILAAVFLVIHIIGARYLYSFVPYDDWTLKLLGFKLSDRFGWQRNMYDRLVHFSYGLLLFGAMIEGLKAALKIHSLKALIALTLMLNMATSMLYELFEWGIAMTLSPEAAEAYNGQQGDIWDAQKDMALALLGGIIAVPLSLYISSRRSTI